MPAILSVAPGRAVRIPQPLAAVPFAVRIGLQSRRAIITSTAIRHRGNFQIMQSLSDLTHINVFGEREGEMQINGVAFPQICNEFGSGPVDMLQYYAVNRVVARGTPTVIQFGPLVYQGFLADISLELVRPEALISQWTLNFRTFLK